MIKVHKLEDGDVIKIIPMIFNNELTWIKKYDCCFVDKMLIYDDSINGYLRKISKKLTSKRPMNAPIISAIQVTTKYFINIYIDGEIRIVIIGKTLYDLISNNIDLLDIKSNKHIFISKKEAISGGLKFPSFDGSYVFEKNWTSPVCEGDWYDYIKSNGPGFDTWIKKNDVFSKKQKLIDVFGYDALSEVIADDRQIKLNEILNTI